jgi:HTH-type transcriptional regulator/antitoxin HigA
MREERMALKYKIIKSKTQYSIYCDLFEDLVAVRHKTREIREEIELLALLILKYDEDKLKDVDPVQLLHTLMDERGIKARDLVEVLDLSKGLVSDILNYRKALSKNVIRVLADYFQVSQDVLNRPYRLKIVRQRGKK